MSATSAASSALPGAAPPDAMLLPATTVFFDLETGGLLPNRHPITQVAAIAVAPDWTELETLEVKVRFDPSECSAEALALNHYDHELWAKAALPEPDAFERVDGFLRRHASLARLGSRPPHRPYKVARLASYNVTFDLPFLQAWYRRHSRFAPFDSRARCVFQRILWYFDERGEEPESYKLTSVCAALGVDLVGAHDALVDVRATVAVARRLMAGATAAVA